MAQFGTGSAGEFASKFKDTFRQSIRRAIEAYPEARVEITSEGLVMRYSDRSIYDERLSRCLVMGRSCLDGGEAVHELI